MNVRLARVISFIFNPLFVLIFLPFFLVYKTTNSIDAAFFWTAYSLIFIFAAGIFIYIGIKRKRFSDWDVSTRTQRPLLFSFCIITGIIYLIGLYLLNAPYILFVVIIAMLFGIALVSVINRKIKASLHVATISALLLGFVLVYKGYFSLLLLLIPLVAWARVDAKRHSVEEVIAGGIIGCSLLLLIYGFLKLLM